MILTNPRQQMGVSELPSHPGASNLGVDPDPVASAGQISPKLSVVCGRYPGGALGDPRINPIDPEMIVIPAGTFTMGDDDGEYDDEKPAHPVSLDGYEIAKYPLTNQEYLAFLDVAPDHPRTPGVRLKVAKFFYEANRPEEALEHYRALVKRYPDKPGIRHMFADTLYRLLMYDEAYDHYKLIPGSSGACR